MLLREARKGQRKDHGMSENFKSLKEYEPCSSDEVMIYEITICTTKNLTSKISQAGHKRYIVEIWGLLVHFSDQM